MDLYSNNLNPQKEFSDTAKMQTGRIRLPKKEFPDKLNRVPKRGGYFFSKKG
jgi:hypothetical protein